MRSHNTSVQSRVRRAPHCRPVITSDCAVGRAAAWLSLRSLWPALVPSGCANNSAVVFLIPGARANFSTPASRVWHVCCSASRLSSYRSMTGRGRDVSKTTQLARYVKYSSTATDDARQHSHRAASRRAATWCDCLTRLESLSLAACTNRCSIPHVGTLAVVRSSHVSQWSIALPKGRGTVWRRRH
jgi:hypothetical protein